MASGAAAVALVVLAVLAGPAAAKSPGIWPTAHAGRQDSRVVVDRLHSRNNRDHQDYSFLNAVGAIWPDDIAPSAVGYMASTGFLIDACHVLTSLHAVYIDDIVLNPTVGKDVWFAVGQTEGSNSGALQGLKYLLRGTVIARGDAAVIDHFVHNPGNDWALIRLVANVNGAITPMTIATVDSAQLANHLPLSVAGFPADRRTTHGDRLDLKDLWESQGYLVQVSWATTEAAVIESTIQATRGTSGGPLYGSIAGFPHLVIGMHQGIRGNGIDVSEDGPNRQVFFTPSTLTRIRAAQARSACPTP